jgi:uncharacterized protein (DUF488 family)
MPENGSCYTVGHSTHAAETFLELLEKHGIEVVVDVRSAPYSRMAPQFNREPLMHLLKQEGRKYIYLGDLLGARHEEPALLFDDGLVDFEAVRQTESFQEGIERVRNGLAKGYAIALMCSEKEPFDCHRFVLVARELSLRGVEVTHILPEGTVTQEALEERLFAKYKRQRHNLLTSEEEALAEVYRLRNRDIAYNAHTKEGDAL